MLSKLSLFYRVREIVGPDGL